MHAFTNAYGRFLFLSFFVELGFELRASCLQKRALLLEPYLQSILLWLFFGDGVLRTVCLGWPPAEIFPILAFQVSSITDMSHRHLAKISLFQKPGIVMYACNPSNYQGWGRWIMS
jgi:hypothetical protein